MTFSEISETILDFERGSDIIKIKGFLFQ